MPPWQAPPSGVQPFRLSLGGGESLGRSYCPLTANPSPLPAGGSACLSLQWGKQSALPQRGAAAPEAAARAASGPSPSARGASRSRRANMGPVPGGTEEPRQSARAGAVGSEEPRRAAKLQSQPGPGPAPRRSLTVGGQRPAAPRAVIRAAGSRPGASAALALLLAALIAGRCRVRALAEGRAADPGV